MDVQLDFTRIAKTEFKVGDTYRMSEKGVAWMGNFGPGRVVGFGRESHVVRIKKHGQKTPKAVHVDFIEHPPQI